MVEAKVAPVVAPKVVKTKAAPKKAAEHPTYAVMVSAALASLKDRKGSSKQAVEKYICANYKVGPKYNGPLKMALKKGVLSGVLVQTKGKGASGSFKIAKVEKPVVKKPAAKKPVAKKPAAKKPVAKKPAAKKVVAKKPAAKKPAAKKPVAKKSPKKVVKKAVVKKVATPKKAGKVAKKATPKKVVKKTIKKATKAKK